MQLEGGVAGGHHSWEDLDELLIATYAKIRSFNNVILCVGGGIGTPEPVSYTHLDVYKRQQYPYETYHPRKLWKRSCSR